MIHNLWMDCQGKLRDRRYGVPNAMGWDGKFSDGIHLGGKDARKDYTDRVVKMITSNFTTPNADSNNSKKKKYYRK